MDQPFIRMTLNSSPFPEELGFLPMWAMNPTFRDLSLRDALEQQYGLPLYEISGGTLDKDGTYRYPGDPPLAPLIRIDRGDEVFYQYPHAIVVIVDAQGGIFATRMD